MDKKIDSKRTWPKGYEPKEESNDDLSPAYLIFKNYELILKWNRSLRFALAVCKLKNEFENVL